ncbi:hypothetical protein P22_1310 [Propionispora sp. 2/2-37]|uniref:glycine cleavage system protein GcvH n=1 Tax=Propionispora sp. 2/2-37 TaxID=1677858 RepID=UPI0006BB5531|nr:glycine cleavage system protein GcvH [Propionispora sp. 2/2-37]CUH95240.1 hypothetical protein P22_1310 [Propionispora sp. 2/2-37]
MDIPKELKYSQDHEWVKVEDNIVTIGITDFAQSQLGDVVFVELPEEGIAVQAGDSISVVESVKAVSDIYAPLSGRVVQVNASLADRPEQINQDAYGAGWIVKVEMSDSGELENLLDGSDYQRLIEEGED